MQEFIMMPPAQKHSQNIYVIEFTKFLVAIRFLHSATSSIYKYKTPVAPSYTSYVFCIHEVSEYALHESYINHDSVLLRSLQMRSTLTASLICMYT